MAMTQAQIEEFNRIRASQSDLAASKWARKQGISPAEFIEIFEKYPVKRNPSATPYMEDTAPKASTPPHPTYKATPPPPVTPKTSKPPAAIPLTNVPPTVTPKAALVTPRPTSIPHPEEQMHPAANLENTNAGAIITRWLQDWGVPELHWDYWRTAIDLQVYDTYPTSMLAMGLTQDTPAAAWEAGGRRHLAIKPRWLNPGVIAHEQAHNSYALLTASQKAEFSAIYTPLKNSDYLIKLLYSKNRYGLTNDVEGHAEVYRYIGQYMPEQLKKYYPRLF